VLGVASREVSLVDACRWNGSGIMTAIIDDGTDCMLSR
jgi:hypothetical protein